MTKLFKAERREQKRFKNMRFKVHANFAAQYNAMEKREKQRKEKENNHARLSA